MAIHTDVPGRAAHSRAAVHIPAGSAGLRQDSVAHCHQVTTLDRGKMATRAGALSGLLLQQVEAGLKMAMSLA